MYIKTLSIVPLLAFLFKGASGQSAATADQNNEQIKLNQALSTWNSRNLIYYDFDLTESYIGVDPSLYPYRVLVEQGNPPKSVNRKGDIVPNPQNIVQLLNSIQSALSASNDRVYAVYDATYGYPISWQIQDVTYNDVVNHRISGFDPRTESTAAAYQTNLNLWNSQRATNYEYQYTQLTHGPDNAHWPLTVQIRNNQYSSSADANANQVLWQGFSAMTISQYFEMIQRQLNANVPYLEVNYAPGTGYPTEIAFIGQDGSWWLYTLQNYRKV